MAAEIHETAQTPYVFLGRSGLKVSNLCLGTANFGEHQFGRPGQTDENASHQIINRYAEWGGNFLDTANTYGLGLSESIVGKWLERQHRDKYVIATKVGVDMGQNVNSVGLSRRHITDSIDRSLQRLHTNFVDLFQTHICDEAVGMEETLRTLDDLVRVGKVRYVGVSNVTGWQLQKLVDTVEKLGANPIISLQQQYSLLVRESELEPFQVCKSAGIGVLPWSPLKEGALTGKIKRGVKPTEGRFAWLAERESKSNHNAAPRAAVDDSSFDIIEAAEAIGKKHGRTTSQVALRWLLQKDVVSSVIFGARTFAQLDNNMGANGWSLTKKEMQLLDDLSTPNTPYPYDFVTRASSDRVNKIFNDYYVRSTV